MWSIGRLGGVIAYLPNSWEKHTEEIPPQSLGIRTVHPFSESVENLDTPYLDSLARKIINQYSRHFINLYPYDSCQTIRSPSGEISSYSSHTTNTSYTRARWVSRYCTYLFMVRFQRGDSKETASEIAVCTTDTNYGEVSLARRALVLERHLTTIQHS